MLKALSVATAVLIVADGGSSRKPDKKKLEQAMLETTICYVLNRRTDAGQWVNCRVRELLPDGGVNPDGGPRRR